MEMEGRVKGRLPLDVVGAVRMDVVNCIGQFNFEGDGFTSRCLHEDLHTTMETEWKVKGGPPLDVVVREDAIRMDIVDCVK